MNELTGGEGANRALWRWDKQNAENCLIYGGLSSGKSLRFFTLPTEGKSTIGYKIFSKHVFVLAFYSNHL